MKILNSTLKVRKFRVSEPSKIPSFDAMFSRIQGFSFDLLDKENGLNNKDSTIQPVHEYTEQIRASDDILMGDYIVMLFCICRKTLKAAEVDIAVKKKIKERYNDDPSIDPNKIIRGVKKEVMEYLLSQKEFTFDLKPIIFNYKTGVGYALGCTESVFNDALEYMAMILGNLEIDFEPFFEDMNFIKWLWYRIENNPTKPVGEAEVVPLGIVDVMGEDEKLKSESDTLEEARLSLLRGLHPTKLGVGFVNKGVIDKVILDGTFTMSVKTELAGFKDKEVACYLDVYQKITEITNFLNTLEEEYKSEEFTDTQVNSWARGDFCIRNYDGL